jgi:TonB family protein
MHPLVRIGLLLVAATAHVSYAADDHPNAVLKRAQAISSLTGPHAQPFHLKLTVSEPTNPTSVYRATIEEYWQSPTVWQRTIESPGFRQNLVVRNGNRVEQNSGLYYPIWLRSFVTASLDPLEDVAFWDQISARLVLTANSSSGSNTSCARAQFKIGTATLNNDAFAVICFNSDGTLSSVVRPGYDMEFRDAQTFGKKRIAHKYVDDPEPGINLVGIVEILEKIDEGGSIPSLPDLSDQSSDPIRSATINQETFERLSSGPPVITWPPVHSGNTSGKLSVYVSADRDGQVREVYPLNSDNAGLQAAARDQLLKVKLKPAVSEGKSVQTESALTFAFSTTLEDEPEFATAVISSPSPGTNSTSTPIKVSPMIANSLRTKSYAPVYPQTLKERRISGKVDLAAVIGRDGKIVSLKPIYSTDPDFTTAAITAVEHWSYKPYLLNGSPTEIETVITMNFQAP